MIGDNSKHKNGYKKINGLSSEKPD